MQGKRPALVVLSILLIVMFIGTDLYTIQVYSDMCSPKDEYSDILQDFIGADIGPARTAFSRADLVADLMAVTTDTTDSDFDNIVDSIEAIIGTDPENNDSDYDRVRDDFEVWNGTDPLEPDSNFDGLADYFELQASNPDVDYDGIDNAWDFDNDNDAVSDEADLSPFCSSTVQDIFHMEIITDGNPTYVTLQFRPRNPSHLKFYYQYWNWPYDTEGLMRDIDLSEEDVRAIPQLNVTTDILPNQVEVSEYGMLVTETGYYVPVNPIWDKGDLVAFECKIFLPESTLTSTALDASLFWRIMGNTDISASALLASNGMYVALGSDATVVADGDSVSGSLQWIDHGDGNVSLKFFNGKYISLVDSSTIGTSSILDDNAKFAYTKNGDDVILRAINGMNVTIDNNGILTLQAPEAAVFQLVDLGIKSEWTTLVTYPESFMLTGLTVEENFETHLGLFYNSTKEPVMAANVLMDYEFMRNSTNTLYDQPSILASNGISVDYLIQSFPHRDLAFTYMSNELLPYVVDLLPDNEILPIIIANQDYTRILELSEITSGVKTYDDSFLLDVTAFPVIEVRTSKMNLYDTTDDTALALDEALSEVVSWNLGKVATFNVLTMVMKWYTGEQLVASIDDVPFKFTKVQNDGSSIPQTILISGLEGLAAYSELMWIFSAFKTMQALKKGGFALNSAVRSIALESKTVIGAWLKTSRSLEKLNKGFTKGFKSFQRILAVAGAVLDVGIAIYSAIMLANSIGGKLGDEIGAVYGITASLVAIAGAAILLAIGAIPYVGWLIALALVIADLIGGYSDKLIAWLSGVIFGDREDILRVEVADPGIEILGGPTTTTLDSDGNGLDVGDTIQIAIRFRGTVNETLGDWIPYTSFIRPYIELFVPQGSVGSTGEPTAATVDAEYGDYWKSETYDSIAWAQPALPMVNYPTWVLMRYNYSLRNRWSHDIMGFYTCYHDDYNTGSNYTFLTKYHFDVMPASIDAFGSWGAISMVDSDGDELKNSEETSTDPWKYDSDGDALRDKYEIDSGLDPNNYDSDGDGLSDKWELVYGTNATMRDSDEDGIPDYTEIAGWNIEFNYTQTEGSVIIPFTTHVYSDPRNNDSDDDNISDFIEYQSKLNPQSPDTNGDSIPDQSAPETEIVVENIWTTSTAPKLDFDVDSDNNIHYGDIPDSEIIKLNQDRNELPRYGGAELTFPAAITASVQDRVYIQDQILASAEMETLVPDEVELMEPVIVISEDGNTLAVGARWPRAVWVYNREGDSWVLEAYIHPDTPLNDFFGFSLALSADGNTLVVGGPEYDYDLWDNGVVLVFSRSGGIWTNTAVLFPPRENAHYFGGSVALSYNGDMLVIGEYKSQWFYIYWFYNNAWNFRYAYQVPLSGYCPNSIAVNRQYFTIVIGTRNLLTDDSAVFVYEYQPDMTFVPYQLSVPGHFSGDRYGYDVDISDPYDNVIIVGTPQSGNGPGTVYVFERSQYGDWSDGVYTTTQLLAPNGHTNYRFGESVTMTPSGGSILIGSPGRGSGAMFAYRKIGSNWIPLSYISPITETECYQFGFDVAMDSSGNRLIGLARELEASQPTPFFEFSASAERIVRFDTDGTNPVVFASRIGYGSAQISTVFGLASDLNGYVYVSYDDTVVAGIRKYSPSGSLVDFIGGDYLVDPRGIDIDSDGNIYVADKGLDDVLKFSPAGDLMPMPWSSLSGPVDVAVDSEGNVYIAETENNRVHIFDENGMNVTSFSYNMPIALNLDENDDLYVANPNYITKFRIIEVVVEIEPPADVADWDEDGLTNQVETEGWEISYIALDGYHEIHVDSNPGAADSDLDGLSDQLEWELGSNPSSGDTDKDALDDFFEWFHGLDLCNYDSDGELLDDSTELTFGSSPYLQDTDNDGTDDYMEFLHGTNPCSIDTDNDGANDTAEIAAGTDPLSPDSDGDFAFDGFELAQGTNPLQGDSDDDFIDDGIEGILGTNPLSNDTDGDNITDFVEISLSLNPLSNDTDGDNVPDNIELEWGTDPRDNDTDNDGIPDGLDPDAPETSKGEIILVADDTFSSEFNTFANTLVNYHNATIVDLADFVANCTDSQWVILVGDPASVPGTVGYLIYTLLEDSPDVLQTMVESGGDHIAVRYGVWNETQTIVMLSEVGPQDVYPVLQALKEKNITMSDDAVLVEFPLLSDSTHIVDIFIELDDIDVVKATDSEVTISLSEPTQPTVFIGLYNDTTTPFQLSADSGLEDYTYPMGKYLEIDLSIEGPEDDLVESAMIRLYYTESDLDRTGDGLANDIEDLNETTLVLYFYDEVEGTWIELHEGLDWVIGTGVNTTDVYLYGELFAGYVWAKVTHLSLYGIAGSTHNQPPDVSNAFPSIEFLWPPNGQFVEISIEGVTDSDGDDVTITILTITSDESVGWCPDAYGIGQDTAWLRAERYGCGNGRVYEITFLASDGQGGESIGSVFVYVPHNKKKGEFVMPINDGQNFDATKGHRPFYLRRKWHHFFWHGFCYSRQKHH